MHRTSHNVLVDQSLLQLGFEASGARCGVAVRPHAGRERIETEAIDDPVQNRLGISVVVLGEDDVDTITTGGVEPGTLSPPSDPFRPGRASR